eukprot:678201-Rhodomonas_salina.1
MLRQWRTGMAGLQVSTPRPSIRWKAVLLLVACGAAYGLEVGSLLLFALSSVDIQSLATSRDVIISVNALKQRNTAGSCGVKKRGMLFIGGAVCGFG